MTLLLLLTVGLFTCIPDSLCRVTTVEDLAVLEGRSLTIPCHYDPQYASYVKYWCHGRMKGFCTSLARTDTPRSTAGPEEEKVSIFDDPVQQVFTVTMTDMKEGDAGWYWCGVEVGGMWSSDVTASLHINVIHGMSVVNSMVSGEEGTSVSVECLYSEKYREIEKKWCRSGDWSSCLVTDAEGTYEDRSVLIRDDRTGAFTVTLSRLEKRDAGWYWCAAGQQRVAIHVVVTTRPTTTAVSAVTSPSDKPQSAPGSSHVPNPRSIAKGWDSQRHFMESPLMVCGAIFLMVVLVMLPWKMWHQYKKAHKRRQAEELKARLSGYPGEGGDWQNASVIFLNSAS